MTDRIPQKATDPATSGSVEPTLRPSDLPPPPVCEPTLLPEVGILPTFTGYTVLRELGRGAFAAVYLARQTALDRLVALKVSPNLTQEARTLAQLEHDHIVRVFSEQVDTPRNLRLMCMQYVPGTTLARVIEVVHNGPPETAGQRLLDLVDSSCPETPQLDIASWRDREQLASMDLLEVVCWTGGRLAEALAYAHQRRVLHRDIKPANILINLSGRPLLADFNVSAVARRRPSSLPSTSGSSGTVTGPTTQIEGRDSVGGTLAYMAPEHIDAFNPENFTPAEEVDQRSDVFSLGVVLYELLTGKLPFDSRPASESDDFLQTLADLRRNGPPAFDRQLNVPPSLERVLRRALGGKKSQRYPSAADFAADLDSCRVLFMVQRQLPRGYLITPLAVHSPFTWSATLVLLPHLVATLINIGYNFSRIVEHFSEPQKSAFLLTTIAYNSFIYPVTITLYLRQLLPLIATWRSLGTSHAPDPDAVARTRQQSLQLAWWVAGLSAIGWMLGGVAWPGGVYLLSGVLSPDDAAHLFVSFTVSGLIAMTYAVIATEFIVVRVLYPGLWLDAENFSELARSELRLVEHRMVAWQLLAVLIPLVGAALMIHSDNYPTFRWLVTGLLILGILGLGLALLAAGLLRQTIAVLVSGTTSRPTSSSHSSAPR